MKIQDMIFIGVNARVAALDRETGETVWQWRSPKGGGYVNLLVDRKLLIAAISGYVYGLEAKTGEQLWFNELKGYGVGVTSIATENGSTSQPVVLEAAAADADAAASSSAVIIS